MNEEIKEILEQLRILDSRTKRIETKVETNANLLSTLQHAHMALEDLVKSLPNSEQIDQILNLKFEKSLSDISRNVQTQLSQMLVNLNQANNELKSVIVALNDRSSEILESIKLRFDSLSDVQDESFKALQANIESGMRQNFDEMTLRFNSVASSISSLLDAVNERFQSLTIAQMDNLESIKADFKVHFDKIEDVRAKLAELIRSVEQGLTVNFDERTSELMQLCLKIKGDTGAFMSSYEVLVRVLSELNVSAKQSYIETVREKNLTLSNSIDLGIFLSEIKKNLQQFFDFAENVSEAIGNVNQISRLEKLLAQNMQHMTHCKDAINHNVSALSKDVQDLEKFSALQAATQTVSLANGIADVVIKTKEFSSARGNY